ncbi:MAG: hypothetical protein WCW31_05350 [Patescibacteria group bacterium]|jgi:hypothetical protein
MAPSICGIYVTLRGKSIDLSLLNIHQLLDLYELIASTKRTDFTANHFQDLYCLMLRRMRPKYRDSVRSGLLGEIALDMFLRLGISSNSWSAEEATAKVEPGRCSALYLKNWKTSTEAPDFTANQILGTSAFRDTMTILNSLRTQELLARGLNVAAKNEFLARGGDIDDFESLENRSKKTDLAFAVHITSEHDADWLFLGKELEWFQAGSLHIVLVRDRNEIKSGSWEQVSIPYSADPGPDWGWEAICCHLIFRVVCEPLGMSDPEEPNSLKHLVSFCTKVRHWASMMVRDLITGDYAKTILARWREEFGTRNSPEPFHEPIDLWMCELP